MAKTWICLLIAGSRLFHNNDDHNLVEAKYWSNGGEDLSFVPFFFPFMPTQSFVVSFLRSSHCWSKMLFLTRDDFRAGIILLAAQHGTGSRGRGWSIAPRCDSIWDAGICGCHGWVHQLKNAPVEKRQFKWKFFQPKWGLKVLVCSVAMGGNFECGEPYQRARSAPQAEHLSEATAVWSTGKELEVEDRTATLTGRESERVKKQVTGLKLGMVLGEIPLFKMDIFLMGM